MQALDRRPPRRIRPPRKTRFAALICLGCERVRASRWVAAFARSRTSCPPAPTRRCAGPPLHYPQLRHVSAVSIPRSPAPRPHNHFLRDSDSILEAALEAREASHWCLLERSNPKRRLEIQEPDRIGPRLTVYGVVLGPIDPYSDLTVTYAVLKDYNSDRRIQPPLWLIHGYATIRYECAVSDPFDARRKPMEFAEVIRCGGSTTRSACKERL